MTVKHPTRAQIRLAVDDLVRRGVVTRIVGADGIARYEFPAAETGLRLLRESRRGGQ